MFYEMRKSILYIIIIYVYIYTRVGVLHKRTRIRTFASESAAKHRVSLRRFRNVNTCNYTHNYTQFQQHAWWHAPAWTQSISISNCTVHYRALSRDPARVLYYFLLYCSLSQNPPMTNSWDIVEYDTNNNFISI